MTYNVFSGTLNPTQLQQLQLNRKLVAKLSWLNNCYLSYFMQRTACTVCVSAVVNVRTCWRVGYVTCNVYDVGHDASSDTCSSSFIPSDVMSDAISSIEDERSQVIVTALDRVGNFSETNHTVVNMYSSETDEDLTVESKPSSAVVVHSWQPDIRLSRFCGFVQCSGRDACDTIRPPTPS